MRVLFFVDRFVPEERANAQLYYDLGKALIGRGHEVGVVTKMPTGYVAQDGECPEGKHFARRETIEGLEVVRVRGLPTSSRTLWVRALDHLIAGFTFAFAARKLVPSDILLVYSPPLTLTFAARLFQKWTGIPYVLNLHDIYPQTLIDLGLLKNRLLIRLAEMLEVQAYRHSAHITVPTPVAGDFVIERKNVPHQKVAFIPNWVDTVKVQPGPKENGFRRAHSLANCFIVSYAGSMGFGQDLTAVLESARVLQKQSDIKFVLVGDGVLRHKWVRMAAGLRNVLFLPIQPREQFFEVLRGSDVCLVPLASALNSPAVPGKTQHIMAVGRPILAVVTASCETAKLVQRSECGLIADPDEPGVVTEMIDRLYRDRALANRLGANGRAYAEEHFSLQRAVDSYELIFGTILKKMKNRAAA
jgi:colanic acid biosynthesis glycosyl transferase WcaI